MPLDYPTFVSNAPSLSRKVAKLSKTDRLAVPAELQEYGFIVDVHADVVVLVLPLSGREVRRTDHELLLRAVNALDERVGKGKTAAIAFATDELPAPEVVRFLADKGYVVTRTRTALTPDAPLLRHARQRGIAFTEALRERMREGQEQLALYRQHADMLKPTSM